MSEEEDFNLDSQEEEKTTDIGQLFKNFQKEAIPKKSSVMDHLKKKETPLEVKPVPKVTVNTKLFHQAKKPIVQEEEAPESEKEEEEEENAPESEEEKEEVVESEEEKEEKEEEEEEREEEKGNSGRSKKPRRPSGKSKSVRMVYAETMLKKHPNPDRDIKWWGDKYDTVVSKDKVEKAKWTKITADVNAEIKAKLEDFIKTYPHFEKQHQDRLERQREIAAAKKKKEEEKEEPKVETKGKIEPLKLVSKVSKRLAEEVASKPAENGHLIEPVGKPAANMEDMEEMSKNLNSLVDAIASGIKDMVPLLVFVLKQFSTKPQPAAKEPELHPTSHFKKSTTLIEKSPVKQKEGKVEKVEKVVIKPVEKKRPQVVVEEKKKKLKKESSSSSSSSSSEELDEEDDVSVDLDFTTL